MCDKKSFRTISKSRYPFLILLALLLLVGSASAGTHADAQATAQKYQTALSLVVPYENNITSQKLAVIGYDIGNYSGATYMVKIYNATYLAEKGLLQVNISVTRDNKELDIKNPVKFYMPFIVSETTNTQRLNSFLKVFVGWLESKPFGTITFGGGDPTLVVYPTVDGYTEETTNAVFATIRAAPGDSADSTSATAKIWFAATTTTNEYDFLRRGHLSYNSAALPDDCTINSAKVGLWGWGSDNAGLTLTTAQKSLYLTQGTLADNTLIAAGDYDGFSDSTVSDTGYTPSTWTEGAYNNYTFNAGGLAYISKTGYTVVFSRLGLDSTNSEPGWASAGYIYITYTNTEQSAEHKPFLEIVYTEAAPPPVCDFHDDDQDVCTTQQVQFTDDSTNTPTDWDWDIDHNVNHGKDYDTQNPQHTYGSAGTYDVELYCGNAGGYDTELKLSYISVDAAITAGFSADDTDVCTTQEVTFIDVSSGTEESYCWDIDHDEDCDYATQNAAHTYGSAGTYSVSEIVDNSGCSPDEELKNSYISVDAALTTDFTPSTLQNICEGDHVDFNDASSGTEESYIWDCEYNTGTDYTTENAQCTYATAGTYTPYHSVDNSGCSPSTKQYSNIVHVDAPTTSDFTYGDVTICEGESVSFTDASTGSEDSWKWDCTNNGINDYTTENAQCTYPDSGTYSVEHCTDSAGCSEDCEVKTDLVIVSECPVPIAAFSCTPLSGYDPLSVDCTDSSTGSPTSWSWKRKTTGGYVEFSTDQNPTDISFTVGTWDVKLTATNEYGYDDEEKLDYIVVSPAITPVPVVASFTANVTCGDEPLSVQFTDTSSGGPDEWYWDFNDGNTSILQNPVNTFYNGSYSVYFHATNTTIPSDDWENKTDYIRVPCEEETIWFHLPPFYSVENITGPFNNITIGIFPIALGEIFKAGNILIPYLAFLFGWLLFLSIFIGGRRI